MKKIADVKLKKNEQNALTKIKQRLLIEFNIDEIILFGSVARGEADEESDIDLLIIIRKPFDRPLRYQITKLFFEINLEYETSFSSLVVDKKNWEEGPISILPIHDEILNEGIAV